MAGTPTLLPESGLGNTLRRDAWWTELIPIFVLMGGFSLYAFFSGVRKQVFRVGTISFTFLFAAHRPAASLVAAFSGVSDSGGAHWDSALRVITTAKRCIARFCSTLPLAPWESLPAGDTAVKRNFRSSYKICIATFCISRYFSWCFYGTTWCWRFAGTAISVSEWARWCSC